MKPLRQSIFASPLDTWESIAARVLGNLNQDAAVAQLQSWNLHIFARRVLSEDGKLQQPILPSDIVFVEPHAAAIVAAD